jgi:TolB protein
MPSPVYNSQSRFRLLISGLIIVFTCLTICTASATDLRLLAHDPMAGTDAAISADGGYFVTSSRRAGNLNLWLFNIHDGQWSQLTEGEAEDSEPQWSPDGKFIAFTSDRGGDKGIWILRLADRSVQKVVTGEDESEYPNWSPDGKSIVYTGGPWKARRFYIVSIDGGNPRPISPRPGHVGACSYFIDGLSLVCHSYENGLGMIERLTLDGQLITRLTDGSWDYKPTTSPDGKWVAFSRLEGQQAGIWIVPTVGGTPRPLVQSIYQDRWPMFTRTGELFFHRIVEQGAAVLVLDRTSGEVTTLIDQKERPRQAAFSPDGRQVAYCAQLSDKFLVRVFDRDTGQRRNLDFGNHEACFPRWSPDGSTIAAIIRQENRWKIATIRSDGSGLRVWEGPSSAKIFEGPLDWSPNGTRLSFAAETHPYESDIFVLDVRSGEIRNITQDTWYHEAPAWTADGEALTFMSNRGGNWTFGLFRLSLSNGELTQLIEPDHIEKNFPRLAANGSALWTQLDRCTGHSYLTLRSPDGATKVLYDHPGATWPSESADQREVLFTAVLHDVQYWLHPGIQSVAQKQQGTGHD